MRDKITTAVIGYGSQGQAWAQNLRDSGRNIVLGLPLRDPSRKLASRDGIHHITSIAEATKLARIIIFAFPDHLHGKVFDEEIKPNLKPKSSLIFLHGFSIHFGTVKPPKNCDIILLAPLGPGLAVREKYIGHESIGYFYGIHRSGSGHAKRVLDQLIKDLRIDRKAMIKTTFRDEAIGDLFGEQAVLCGGLSQLIKAGYDTLTESGLSSDKAYLEVAYQIDLIADLIKKYGVEGMSHRISLAARYGSYLTGPKIINSGTKRRMKKILSEIKTGRFARRLNCLTPAKIKELDRQLKKLTSPSFEQSARKFSPINSKKK